MSFPITAGYRILADRGPRDIGWVRWLGAKARAILGNVLLYRWVLRRADHVFVQSEAMRQDIARHGVPMQRMTAVPMGVDLEALPSADQDTAKGAFRWPDREPVLYVGTLGGARQLDLMLEAFAIAHRQRPQLLMLMVGEESVTGEKAALQATARALGIAEHVVWMGWQAPSAVFPLMRQCLLGLSLIPRGPLFDVSSPTKLVEYLAMGLPAVASDVPDQVLVAERSQAAMVVPMQAAQIAQAILRLAADPSLRQRMAEAGPAYVARERSYELLGRLVAQRLHSLAHAV
jgi:glycosyltransferase involved in cell wall biosynthesis